MKLTPEFDTLFEVTNNLKKSDRALRVPGTERYENTAEHSYELAMTCWFLIETFELELDLARVLKYALSHDLGEWKHGDVSAFDKTQEHEVLEELATLELIKSFEKWSAPGWCLAYEYQKEASFDPEACFVHFVDRLVGNFNCYLDNLSTNLDRSLDDIRRVAFDYNYPAGNNIMEPLFERMILTYNRMNQIKSGLPVL